MAELEVDQSHLPRVQEVCQCFAVLEDGALAHNLQEQEIEHYYTANIQKNQLVQNDIRIAKELQQEEQQRTLLRQASRQLEEQDSEYARGIQEEIQRCAEEARRREQEDEEIAKRIQEEEEERIRARGHERLSDDDTNGPTLSSPHQHTHQGDGQHCPSAATRWQCSTSCSLSHSSGSQAESPMREEALKYTTSRSNEGRTHSTRQIRHELREPLSENSEDSDTVFSEQPPSWSQRPVNRPPTLHCGRPAFHQPCERDLRRVQSSRSRRERQRGWEEHRGGRVFENGGRAENGPRDTEWERSHREQVEGRHSNGVRCFILSESFRVHAHRPRDLAPRDLAPRDLSRTWTCRESPDKRVHFRDDGYRGDGVWEMLGDVLRERGVAVRLGVPGAPLKLDLQSRSDAQPHQRVLQRSATNRSSYRGDAWQRRWSSSKGDGAEARRGERERLQGRAPTVVEEGEVDVCQDLSGDSGGGVRRCGAREVEEEEERSSWGHHTGRVGRSRSERCYRYEEAAERLRPEEVDTPQRSKAPGRSHSFSSRRLPARAVPRHASSAGLAVHEETCLDLRELQQVLQDEELARQLQDEEHGRMLRRSHPASYAPRTPYPEGDFRVAQVAQDEEIARFIQKQEIKIKRRSRELEGPGPFHEHREMMSHGDRRAVRDREVQRERLDSEGLPSPTEDFSLENQQASPVSTLQGQQIRNVAEELDPTFKARLRDRDSLRAGQMGPASQSNPITQPGLHNFLEEPAFIPPTKRQNDKSARFTTKAKERKEKCKQQ